MKGLLKQIGQKLTEAVDSVAAYNAPELSHGGAVSVSASSHTSKAAKSLDQADPSDPVLQHLLRNVRSRHVRHHFFSKPASGYTHSKPVRIMVGSYNVNGKKPSADLDLKEWLGLAQGCWPPAGGGAAGEEGQTSSGDEPDILAVGFQEIVPLNASNVIVGSATANLEAWDKAIGTYLNGETWAAQQYGPSGGAGDTPGLPPNMSISAAMDTQWHSTPITGGNKASAGSGGGASQHGKSGSGVAPPAAAAWLQVAARQLVGTYITVWVRRGVLEHVKGVQATHTATGFGGYLGNKGAVVVRMRVYDSPLVLLCAHLSAGEQEGDELRRNNDVAEILRRTDFTSCASLGIGHWGLINTILDHHNVIWMGDLNYRLGSSLISDDDARKALRSGDLAPLLAADQLCRERAAGRVFQGWQEGPLTFPPTFKFKVGTHMYLGEPDAAAPSDPSDYDPDEGTAGGKQKRRTPAWCDRVLWLGDHGVLRQVCYKRSELTASDHKPVAAAFVLQARHYDRPRVEAALQEARKAVDMQAAMQRPKCVLDPNQVTLTSPLTHAEVSRHVITLTNTGAVEGMWHFIPPPDLDNLDSDIPPLPPWLRAIPSEGVVAPGGGQVDITLEVCVEGGATGAAASLGAAGSVAALEAIVILRIEDGGDKFVCVNGSCQLSFLGQPLSRLVDQAATSSSSGGGDTAAQQVCGNLIKQGCVGLPHLATRLESRLQAQHPDFTLLNLTDVALLGRAVPQPWRALLAGLLASPDHVLQTPGLFLTSACQVLSQQPPESQPDDVQDTAVWSDRQMTRRLLQHVAGLRQRVDAGEGLDVSQPHAAAALLFAALVELPKPLIPLQLSELCNTQEPNQLVVDRVLGTALHPPEATLLCAVLAVLSQLPAASDLPATPPIGGTLETGSQLQQLCEVASVVLMGPARQGEAGEAAARRQLLVAQLLYHTRT